MTNRSTRDPEPNLRQAAARGVLWTIANTWGTRVVTLVVFGILARNLTASAFGLMALAVAMTELLRMMLTEGLTRAVVQRTDLDDGHRDSAFWASIGIGAVLCLTGVLAAGPIADGFGEPQLTPILRAMSFSFVLTALSTVQVGILQRNLQFRGLAIRQLIATAAGGVVGVVLATTTDAGVWALVAQHLTLAGVGTIVLWTVTTWRPGLRVSRSHLREMLGFGLTTQAIHMIGFIGQRGEVLVIGALLGSVPLGFYSLAQRLLEIVIQVFSTTINTVAFPVFSRLQGQPDRIRSALHQASRMGSVAGVPGMLLLAVLAPEIVSVTFGDRWGQSARLLQIIALAGLVYNVTFFGRSVTLAVGRAGLELAWTVSFVLTKTGAVLVGIQWGIEGAAWATVMHAYAMLPLRILTVNRATPIEPLRYVATIVKPVLASLVMLAAVLAVRLGLSDQPDLLVLAVAGFAGAAVYVGVLHLIARETVREVLVNLNAVRRKRVSAP